MRRIAFFGCVLCLSAISASSSYLRGQPSTELRRQPPAYEHDSSSLQTIDNAIRPIDFDPDECVKDWTSLQSTMVLATVWSPNDYHDFTLCPGTVFLLDAIASDESHLKPIEIKSRNAVFRCGDDGKLENNCLILGGYAHFKIVGSVQGVSFMGITFSGAKLSSILATGESDADIELNNCAWIDNSGYTSILIYNEDKGSPVLADSEIVDLVEPRAKSMSVSCDSCIFSKNKANNSTIVNFGGDLTLKESIFMANEVLGGVVISKYDSILKIEGSCFLKNKGGLAGTVVVDERSTVELNKNTFGDSNDIAYGTCDEIFFEVGKSCVGGENSKCVGLCGYFTANVCTVDLEKVGTLSDLIDELYPTRSEGKSKGGQNSGKVSVSDLWTNNVFIGIAAGTVIIVLCCLGFSYRFGQKSVLAKYAAIPIGDDGGNNRPNNNDAVATVSRPPPPPLADSFVDNGHAAPILNGIPPDIASQRVGKDNKKIAIAKVENTDSKDGNEKDKAAIKDPLPLRPSIQGPMRPSIQGIENFLPMDKPPAKPALEPPAKQPNMRQTMQQRRESVMTDITGTAFFLGALAGLDELVSSDSESERKEKAADDNSSDDETDKMEIISKREKKKKSKTDSKDAVENKDEKARKSVRRSNPDASDSDDSDEGAVAKKEKKSKKKDSKSKKKPKDGSKEKDDKDRKSSRRSNADASDSDDSDKGAVAKKEKKSKKKNGKSRKKSKDENNEKDDKDRKSSQQSDADDSDSDDSDEGRVTKKKPKKKKKGDKKLREKSEDESRERGDKSRKNTSLGQGKKANTNGEDAASAKAEERDSKRDPSRKKKSDEDKSDQKKRAENLRKSTKKDHSTSKADKKGDENIGEEDSSNCSSKENSVESSDSDNDNDRKTKHKSFKSEDSASGSDHSGSSDSLLSGILSRRSSLSSIFSRRNSIGSTISNADSAAVSEATGMSASVTGQQNRRRSLDVTRRISIGHLNAPKRNSIDFASVSKRRSSLDHLIAAHSSEKEQRSIKDRDNSSAKERNGKSVSDEGSEGQSKSSDGSSKGARGRTKDRSVTPTKNRKGKTSNDKKTPSKSKRSSTERSRKDRSESAPKPKRRDQTESPPKSKRTSVERSKERSRKDRSESPPKSKKERSRKDRSKSPSSSKKEKSRKDRSESPSRSKKSSTKSTKKDRSETPSKSKRSSKDKDHKERSESLSRSMKNTKDKTRKDRSVSPSGGTKKTSSKHAKTDTPTKSKDGSKSKSSKRSKTGEDDASLPRRNSATFTSAAEVEKVAKRTASREKLARSSSENLAAQGRKTQFTKEKLLKDMDRFSLDRGNSRDRLGRTSIKKQVEKRHTPLNTSTLKPFSLRDLKAAGKK